MNVKKPDEEEQEQQYKLIILLGLGGTYDCDFINNPLEACILSHDLY